MLHVMYVDVDNSLVRCTPVVDGVVSGVSDGSRFASLNLIPRLSMKVVDKMVKDVQFCRCLWFWVPLREEEERAPGYGGEGGEVVCSVEELESCVCIVGSEVCGRRIL